MADKKEVGYSHSVSVITAPDGLSDEVETTEVRYYVLSNGSAEVKWTVSSSDSEEVVVEVEQYPVGHWQYIPNGGASYGGQAIGYKEPVPAGTGFGGSVRR